MDRFMDDIRHGIRSLRRAPAFTLTSALSLALGIGTATAVFAGFRAVVLDELPVTGPNRIVLLSLQRQPTGSVPLAPEEIDALRRESRTLLDVAGVSRTGAVAIPLTEDERSLVLDAATVTASFFQVLGVRPVLGRLLRPEDGEEGAALVTVISHETWQREFGGDRAVLGRQLTQTQYQDRYTIIGVAPPGLDYPVGADYWIPSRSRSSAIMDVVARLRHGVAPEAARAEFVSIGRAIDGRRSVPRSPTAGTVQPLSEAVLGDAKPLLLAITAAAALLLLIACVNVGNLLLMRATQRSGDVVLRRALGATSDRIARLFLVEGAVLGAVGGALGLAVAVGLLRVLPALAPARFPRMDMIGLAGAPVAVAIAVSALAVLLFGVGPAMASARGDFGSALRADGRSGSGTRSRRRLRRFLVAAQVALAVTPLAPASDPPGDLDGRRADRARRGIGAGGHAPRRSRFRSAAPRVESGYAGRSPVPRTPGAASHVRSPRLRIRAGGSAACGDWTVWRDGTGGPGASPRVGRAEGQRRVGGATSLGCARRCHRHDPGGHRRRRGRRAPHVPPPRHAPLRHQPRGSGDPAGCVYGASDGSGGRDLCSRPSGSSDRSNEGAPDGLTALDRRVRADFLRLEVHMRMRARLTRAGRTSQPLR